VVDAVAGVWGPRRVGVRIGPNNVFNEMHDSDPKALFSHVAAGLRDRGIAYLHIIEPRIKGNTEIDVLPPVAAATLKSIFQGPVIAAGGFDREQAIAIVENGGADLVAFGRYFIANPDLPLRLREGLPLNAYDRNTFYYGGAQGYADYPSYQAAKVA